MYLITFVWGVVEHERETGGGPTGFGWASFLTLLAGIIAIAFMLGRYLQSLAALRRERAEGGTNSTMAGSTRCEQRTDFDPYDDLKRDSHR
ncbi:MAG TPA: hypothetical protein DEB20_01200 [Acidimicrobiaceae bacterium]|nr:hypothetical protein [Acidimicrobiaceae bacterium]